MFFHKFLETITLKLKGNASHTTELKLTSCEIQLIIWNLYTLTMLILGLCLYLVSVIFFDYELFRIDWQLYAFGLLCVVLCIFLTHCHVLIAVSVAVASVIIFNIKLAFSYGGLHLFTMGTHTIILTSNHLCGTVYPFDPLY
jgi:hypothetical protein